MIEKKEVLSDLRVHLMGQVHLNEPRMPRMPKTNRSSWLIKILKV